MTHEWIDIVPDWLRDQIEIREDQFHCRCGKDFRHDIRMVELAKHALNCVMKPPVDSSVRECPMCHATRPRSELVCLECQRAAQARLKRGYRV